jgi:acyl-CoA synthetase (AMP-forming)/AMP-acid ligase II
MNLSLLLDMATDGFGDRIVAGRRADGMTARRLRGLSNGGAVTIGDADALLYLDVNGPAFPVALFAAARAGVPLVPLNYRLGAEQLEELLSRHPGAVGIGASGTEAIFERIGIRHHTTETWLAAAAAEETTASGDVDPAVERPAVIIYTSGTTSAPKGVLLRHDNLISYVLGTVEFGSADAAEGSLVSVPPYHIAAVVNTITNLYAGRRSIVLDQFSGEKWLDLARDEEMTHALVVPTMLARIMSVDGSRAVPSLRSLAYGGASMPTRVITQALVEWRHVDFVNAYGLTETSSTVAVLGPEDHRAAIASEDPAVRARLASAGRPVPGIEVEIRDPGGAALPADEVGRIWVRGEQVSGEYTGIGSVLSPDGFFDTRDEGYFDDAGYLFVSGRVDDTIIRGGENIAPAEIETVILTHHDIDDAVVVGVSDHEWGQRLEAVVVARPGHTVDEEDLRAFVHARLRRSKTPDRFVVWPELPRTATGKIARRAVVAKLAQESAECGSVNA